MRNRAFDGALVIALFIRARYHHSIFADSFHQVFVSAVGTLLRNRLCSRGELALRIIPAPVKRIAFACALFDELAFFAFRTLHADKILLHIFAFGISAARSELAVAAMSQDQIAFAQWAGFIEWNIGHLLALIKPPRCLAVGIAGAGHELAEASTLQNHHATAIFAI